MYVGYIIASVRVKETTGEFKGFKEALLGPRQRLDTDGKRVMTGG